MTTADAPSLDALLTTAAVDVGNHDAHGCDGVCEACGCCLVYPRAGCVCTGPDTEDCGCLDVALTDGTLTDQAETARAVAVRLEQELDLLRIALIGLHAPAFVGSDDPEDPDVICPTCRTDYPCETRSYVDALDPARTELDEFASADPPF